MSKFSDECSSLIGSKKFEDCVHLSSHLSPKFSKILNKYIDPKSKDFNREKGLKRGSDKSEEIAFNSRKDSDLVVFFNSKNQGVHVGICVFNGIIHYTKEGIVFQEIEDVNYPTFKIFKGDRLDD